MHLCGYKHYNKSLWIGHIMWLINYAAEYVSIVYKYYNSDWLDMHMIVD